MTLPTTKKGLSKVFPNKGVVINNIRYWTPYFRNSKIENQRVPVRFDPFNVGIGFAYVNGSWQRCLSAYHDVFNNRTEKEILIAAAEIKELRKGKGRFNLNSKILAQFLLSTDAAENELLTIQKLKDLEIKRIINNEDQFSNYRINTFTQDTVKLLSGEPSPIPLAESENFDSTFLAENSDVIDFIDDEDSIDVNSLKTFGDY